MSTKDLAHGVAEVRRVMERVDTNGDGVIDFGEFCALARANSDLELVLHSLTVEEPRVCFGVFFPHMHQSSKASHPTTESRCLPSLTCRSRRLCSWWWT